MLIRTNELWISTTASVSYLMVSDMSENGFNLEILNTKLLTVDYDETDCDNGFFSTSRISIIK